MCCFRKDKFYYVHPHQQCYFYIMLDLMCRDPDNTVPEVSCHVKTLNCFKKAFSVQLTKCFWSPLAISHIKLWKAASDVIFFSLLRCLNHAHVGQQPTTEKRWCYALRFSFIQWWFLSLLQQLHNHGNNIGVYPPFIWLNAIQIILEMVPKLTVW